MTQPLRFWMQSIFLYRPFLLLLVIINGGGTVYGYIWYAAQLEHTWTQMSPWLVAFVPDSPTASLFFTMSIAWLWVRTGKTDQQRASKDSYFSLFIRSLVDTMAVVTSFKYGIWAVVMIFAGAYHGSEIVWQQWMLVVSHLGMAVEALLYAKHFTFRILTLAIVAMWTLANDFIDYSFGVFPWLPQVLHPYLHWISMYTIGMSVLSVAIVAYFIVFTPRNRKSSV